MGYNQTSYKKGHKQSNTGRTHFKKGQLSQTKGKIFAKGRLFEGYKYLPIDNQWVFEHRYLWEKANGPIPKDSVIHHINGNKLDNQLENLQLLNRSEHAALHHSQGDIRGSD